MSSRTVPLASRQALRMPRAGLALAFVTLTLPLAGAAIQPQLWDDAPGDTPSWARSFGGEPIFTEPSRSAVIGFDVPTSVREVLVVGGQRVRQGDLLVRGDDAEELAVYRTQEIQVREALEVDRAAKALELARIEYQKTQDAYASRGATELDVDRRRVSMEVAEVDLQIEKMRAEQAAVQLERFAARVERYRLRAPFDGVIERVEVDVGQSMRESEPVVRVVSIDSLRADVPVSTELTLELDLSPGDPAWVLLDAGPAAREVYRGVVTEVSPVAFFATRQRRVRVEFPNPRGRPAGLAAWVRFTEPPPEWRDRLVEVPAGAPAGSGDQ